MNAAVNMVQAVIIDSGATFEPVTIVDKLFANFPGYIIGFEFLSDDKQQELRDDPKLMQELVDAGWHAYLKDAVGGAWPLDDQVWYGAQCQAIVRFIRGVLHQVGCPGLAELKYVTVDATKSFYDTVIADSGHAIQGPDKTKQYGLVDRPVEVGKIYKDTDPDVVGFNNYEAYLRFTYPEAGPQKKAYWFGGGVGKLADGRDPLSVFSGLAEVEFIYDRMDGLVPIYARKVTRFWSY
jgi:hypothetical protein